MKMKDTAADPYATGTAPPVVFIMVFVAVVFGVGMMATAVTFLLPEAFGCTARISTKPDPASGPAQPVSSQDFILATCQIIQSPAVLTPVIEKLDAPQRKCVGESISMVEP